MSSIFEKTLLYDFYGELLTEHQKEIYELYNLNDLSLGEISEQLGISRQGVHDTLKRCDKQLDNYENKLQLVDKFLSNKQKIDNIFTCTSSILEELALQEKIPRQMVISRIEEIQKACKNILEEL
ncbi:MAG: YlxM family DNA-binding protein [Vallitalea sp.]|jgi:predicted DNA-binding protein YlxM (UPF0122 family)|nr:YlxM family DNA-binding protein [Vallitalea sp.]